MKSKMLTTGLGLVFLVGTALAEEPTHPDFSGEWSLDSGRSDGISEASALLEPVPEEERSPQIEFKSGTERRDRARLEDELDAAHPAVPPPRGPLGRSSPPPRKRERPDPEVRRLMSTIVRDAEGLTIVQGEDTVTVVHPAGSVRTFSFAETTSPGVSRRAIWRGRDRLSLITRSGDAVMSEVLALDERDLKVTVLLMWSPSATPVTLNRVYRAPAAPDDDSIGDSTNLDG